MASDHQLPGVGGCHVDSGGHTRGQRHQANLDGQRQRQCGAPRALPGPRLQTRVELQTNPLFVWFLISWVFSFVFIEDFFESGFSSLFFLFVCCLLVCFCFCNGTSYVVSQFSLTASYILKLKYVVYSNMVDQYEGEGGNKQTKTNKKQNKEQQQ